MSLQRNVPQAKSIQERYKAMNDTYNGWTNWDTWNANLHMTNNEFDYKIARKLTSKELPAFFKDSFIHITDDREYDGIDINRVNWLEIFEGLR